MGQLGMRYACVGSFAGLDANTFRCIALSLISFIAASCSLVPQSSIPGGSSDPITLKPIPLSTVLIALKCQVEQGLERIEAQKQNLARNGDPRWQSFQLRDGTVTFTGKTTTVGTDDADISIAIPVGISTVTPSVGGKLTGTATEEISRAFGIGTDVKLSICGHAVIRDEGINVGTFFSDRMVAAFNDTLAIPEYSRNARQSVPFGPSLRNNELKLAANFSVQRTLEAGVKAEVLFSSTNSSSPTLTPGIAFANDAKGEYAITVTFPMLASDKGDNRRFYQCVRKGAVTYCLEAPYVEEKHRDRLTILSAEDADIFGTLRQPDLPEPEGREPTDELPPPFELLIEEGPVAF